MAEPEDLPGVPGPAARTSDVPAPPLRSTPRRGRKAGGQVSSTPRRLIESVETGRIPYFDNLKYFLIVLVVIGHFVDPFSSAFPQYAPLFFFIYLFHMPLFVFSTGLFAQNLLRADGGFRVARVAQFLVLYLVLYSGIWGLERANGKDSPFTPWSVGNASWYLLACALWYLAAPALTRITSPVRDHRSRPKALPPTTDTLAGRGRGELLATGSDESPGNRPLAWSWRQPAALSLLVVIALAAGYFPAIGDLFSLSRVICFAPFFFLGFWVSRQRVAAWADRALGWKLAAAAVLVATLAAVYAFPVLLKVRGILTARNSYAVLHGYAGYGAGFRMVWLVGALVLGAAVLLLVPRRRAWFTTLGERTLPIYIWHLFALRGLALIAFIPLVRGWHQVTPIAAAVPLASALIAAHLFGVKPPFGVISDRVLAVGRAMVLPARVALPISLATLLALPAAAFAMSTQPLLLQLPRGFTPWLRPSASEPATVPTPAPPVELPAGEFELQLKGATGFVVVPTTLEPADGLPGGDLRPGASYTITRDEGATWVVETKDAGGRLPAAAQLVNLPDLIPSIVYSPTPGFTSSGVALDVDLAPVSAANPRLGIRAPYFPVSYPMALRLQNAQQAARASGETLVVHDTFRSADAQRSLAQALLRLYDADDQVRAGIDPWRPSDFAPLVLSNHSLGVTADLSLARVTSVTEHSGPAGDFALLTTEALPLPTAVHELSRAAAALARPVKSVDGTEWQAVPAASTLTDAALRLRGYLTEAGLAPSGAWWEFTDWDARRAVPAATTGNFTLTPP